MSKIKILFQNFIFPTLIICFLGWFIFNNKEQILYNEYKINYLLLTASSFIYIFTLFFQLYIWYFITKKHQIHLDIKHTFISKTYSEFGKYIPGKIWEFAWLFNYYEKNGRPKKIVAVCYYLEALSSLFIGFIIFLFTIYQSSDFIFFKYQKQIVLILIFALFFLLHPYIINKILNIFLHILKKEKLSIIVKSKDILIFLSLTLINWLIFGVSFFLFVNSFYSASFHLYFYILGSFSLSVISVILIFFIPTGMGVREGILIICLTQIMPLGYATVIAIASRLFFTYCELIRFFIILIFDIVLKKKIQKDIDSLNKLMTFISFIFILQFF